MGRRILTSSKTTFPHSHSVTDVPTTYPKPCACPTKAILTISTWVWQWQTAAFPAPLCLADWPQHDPWRNGCNEKKQKGAWYKSGVNMPVNLRACCFSNFSLYSLNIVSVFCPKRLGVGLGSQYTYKTTLKGSLWLMFDRLVLRIALTIFLSETEALQLLIDRFFWALNNNIMQCDLPRRHLRGTEFWVLFGVFVIVLHFVPFFYKRTWNGNEIYACQCKSCRVLHFLV